MTKVTISTCFVSLVHFNIQLYGISLYKMWFSFLKNGQYRKLEKMMTRKSSIISLLLAIAVQLSPVDCF